MCFGHSYGCETDLCCSFSKACLSQRCCHWIVLGVARYFGEILSLLRNMWIFGVVVWVVFPSDVACGLGWSGFPFLRLVYFSVWVFTKFYSFIVIISSRNKCRKHKSNMQFFCFVAVVVVLFKVCVCVSIFSFSLFFHFGFYKILFIHPSHKLNK